MRYHLPIYVLCVSSHFWPFTKVNFVLPILQKNWDSVRPPRPAPWLGQNPKFVKGNKLLAPLRRYYEYILYIMNLNRTFYLPILVFGRHVIFSTFKMGSDGMNTQKKKILVLNGQYQNTAHKGAKLQCCSVDFADFNDYADALMLLTFWLCHNTPSQYHIWYHQTC